MNADIALEEMFLRSLWKGHGLSRPPHGRLLHFKGEAKLETFKPKSLQSFHKRSHHPRGLTVTVAGDLDHEKLLALVDKLFAPLPEPPKTVSTLVPATHQFLALRNRSLFSSARFRVGTEMCSADNAQSEVAAVLNSVVGEGPGSRLARLVHEKQIAAQAACSSLQMFSDTGCFSVSVRTESANISRAIEQIVQQLRGVATATVNASELEQAKAFRKAALCEEAKSTSDCIASLARDERYLKRLASIEERVAAIEEVSAAKLRSVAAQWFTPYSLSLAVLGKLDGVNITSANLRW
jgi:predicted Zn-dependent peptidase